MIQAVRRHDLTVQPLPLDAHDASGRPVAYITHTGNGMSSVRSAQQALRCNEVEFPEGVSTILVAVFSTRLQSWWLIGEHPFKLGYDGAHVPPEGRELLWRKTEPLTPSWAHFWQPQTRAVAP